MTEWTAGECSPQRCDDDLANGDDSRRPHPPIQLSKPQMTGQPAHAIPAPSRCPAGDPRARIWPPWRRALNGSLEEPDGDAAHPIRIWRNA